MTAEEDLALTQRYYSAGGDQTVVDEVMSAAVVWNITPGFPNGGVYEGLDAVRTHFLAPFGRLFTSIGAHPEQFFADGQGHVTALGHYTVTTTDGRQADSRFAHIWTIADGQLVRLDQTADSFALIELLSS